MVDSKPRLWNPAPLSFSFKLDARGAGATPGAFPFSPPNFLTKSVVT